MATRPATGTCAAMCIAVCPPYQIQRRGLCVDMRAHIRADKPSIVCACQHICVCVQHTHPGLGSRVLGVGFRVCGLGSRVWTCVRTCTQTSLRLSVRVGLSVHVSNAHIWWVLVRELKTHKTQVFLLSNACRWQE